MARQIAASELVEDFDFYPRRKVDPALVRKYAECVRAEVEFPPVIIEKRTNRIVDGFHRRRAYVQVHGEDVLITVEEMTFRNDRELFKEAVRRNAQHGDPFSPHDRTHILAKAREWKLDVGEFAGMLSLTQEKAEALLTTRTARGAHAECVPIKATIRHMAGEKLNQAQVNANERLGGMNQSFYANQLIMLLENDLLDTEDEELMKRLRRLAELLDSALSTEV